MNEETQQDSAIDAQQVISFLAENPSFLMANPDLLKNLEVASQNEGAISLADRQLRNLRKENQELKRDLQLFIVNARENESLLNKTFDLCLELLACSDIDNLTSTLTARCRAEFDLPLVNLLLNSSAHQDAHSALSTEQLKQHLGDNLPTDKIITGRLRNAEKEFLFNTSKDVSSVALIPLGDKCNWGLLALGSNDEQHFDPEKGDLFLQLIARTLVLWMQSQE